MGLDIEVMSIQASNPVGCLRCIEGMNYCEDWEWEDLCSSITNIMENIQPDCSKYGAYWEVEVSGFGWRNQDGKKEIRASTGKELLFGILPKTECSFKIYEYADRIELNNSHHDKPTGGEWYTITKAEDES